ncbi:hypothetical protein RB195_005309 [Necator americanus]|uniref:Uncharacterized protein n=1 Tax=Necator americanus TaxID=51031 RepID=A0ABR1BRA4_NECAM
MKRQSPVLNTANGVAEMSRDLTLPILREHCNTLLNRLTLPVPELVHAQRQTYTTVSEEPPTESEIRVCIQKMKDGKPGGNDGISAEM